MLGAFKLLGALDGTRLPVTSSGALTLDAILNNSVRGQADVDAMATINGQKVQVLVWNYHDDLVTAAAASVQLTVKVPASFGARVTVTHLRVDDTHGDAYTVWMSQGSPATPSAAQIAALQQAMDPAPLAGADARRRGRVGHPELRPAAVRDLARDADAGRAAPTRGSTPRPMRRSTGRRQPTRRWTQASPRTGR